MANKSSTCVHLLAMFLHKISESEPSGLSRRIYPRPRRSCPWDKSADSRRFAASLIELLVVIFIMGIMMSLLLPALQRARGKADEMVCQNNLYQIKYALIHFMDAKRHFPAPHYWTVDILPYIEQKPLAEAMNNGFAANAVFPRPPVYQCPFQPDDDSLVPSVAVCHFVLTVDRSENGFPLIDNGWNIGDRPLLSSDNQEKPWYVSPEISHAEHETIFAGAESPHLDGSFETIFGSFPQ